ncbi:MAG: type III pantothenate kinase [Verrucomicrobiae bacterium]|nr:type III pantothenate kinase [Verrucomicrobiae bacterium]
MILLADIGNTRTHLGWANRRRLLRTREVPTRDITAGNLARTLRSWLGSAEVEGACVCSVVPSAAGPVLEAIRQATGVTPVVLGTRHLPGLSVAYPKPRTIGPDRLAGAVAARWHFGAPVVVVGCGTATTFDVVDPDGCFVGGVIATGLSLLAEALHEHTALLPRIRLRPPRRVVGRSTRESMLSGAVLGYQGLVSEILRRIRLELRRPRLTVVATGGNARWIAEVPGIREVRPNLVLEGLRLTWEWQRGGTRNDEAGTTNIER